MFHFKQHYATCPFTHMRRKLLKNTKIHVLRLTNHNFFEPNRKNDTVIFSITPLDRTSEVLISDNYIDLAI